MDTENEKDEVKNNDTPKIKKNSQSTSFMQSVIKKIGFALLFLLIGALIIGLVLYLPAQTKLKTAQVELDRLRPIETEYVALVEEHEITSARSGVYKTLIDTSMLQIALESNNTNRINQYTRYVEEDLKNLTIPNFPELPASLISQFEKISTSAASNRSKAVNELQDFQNDLLLVADNLE